MDGATVLGRNISPHILPNIAGTAKPPMQPELGSKEEWNQLLYGRAQAKKILAMKSACTQNFKMLQLHVRMQSN